MKRKFLLSILSIALIVALLGFATACGDGNKNPMNNEDGTQGMEYIEVEGGYSLAGIGEAEGTHDLIVPATYNNKPVLSIEPYAFAKSDSIETVTVKEGVKSIGAAAFYSALDLKSVTLPSSIESIGNAAFNNCVSLTTANIPEKVSVIGKSLFYNCFKLTSIEIPAAVVEIGAHAFNKCSELATVTFKGNDVNTLGEYAFANCVKITVLDLPNELKTVANYAFANCTALTSVSFADNLTQIGAFAFSNCKKLTSVVLGENLHSIGESAFDGCAELVLTDLPENVNFIDKFAFRDCVKVGKIEGYIHYIGDWVVGYDSALKTREVDQIIIKDSATGIANLAFSSCRAKEIVIGAGIESIGEGAFSGTIYVTKFSVSSKNNVYTASNGCIYNKEKTELIAYPTGKKVSGIYVSALPRNEADKTLSGVTTIAPYACYWAAQLKTLNLDKIEKKVQGEMKTVWTCEVTSIGAYSFGRCQQITELKIGAQLVSIADYAFYWCNSLKTIIVDEANPNYKSVNNALYTKDGKQLLIFAVGEQLNKVLEVAEGTEEILPAAFYAAPSLEGVILPASITSIGDIAFADCIYFNAVYFKGTLDQWNQIVIAESNNSLSNATTYIYSETEPALNADGTAYDGDYWHYDEKGNPQVWVKTVESAS